jgi:hypothetical protein
MSYKTAASKQVSSSSGMLITPHAGNGIEKHRRMHIESGIIKLM